MKRVFASFNVMNCGGSYFENGIFEVEDEEYESGDCVKIIEKKIGEDKLCNERYGEVRVTLLFFKVL